MSVLLSVSVYLCELLSVSEYECVSVKEELFVCMGSKSWGDPGAWGNPLSYQA